MLHFLCSNTQINCSLVHLIFFPNLLMFPNIMPEMHPHNMCKHVSPRTPNFSDVPLATAHMTDTLTHVFEVSKFLNSHIHHWRHDNPLISVTDKKCTIPTCWVVQDNLDVVHTFYSDFDSAQSALDCQQTMAAISRIPNVTSHSLQHQPKNANCRDAWYISWYDFQS